MRTYFHRRLRAFLFVLLAVVSVTGPQASPDPNKTVDLSSYGIFYDRYEPSFYTGFAPRVEEPRRLHLHVGRGNQLRMTLVVSDAVLAGYAGNLLTRYRTYRGLIDQGKVQPTQNGGFNGLRAGHPRSGPERDGRARVRSGS
ncbi:MAG: hypothetical protein ABFS02_07000 [Pseudomonadota bacterium]